MGRRPVVRRPSGAVRSAASWLAVAAWGGLGLAFSGVSAWAEVSMPPQAEGRMATPFGRVAPPAAISDTRPAEDDDVLRRIRAARASPDGAVPVAPISPVREAALRETAQALGVQAGLGVESRRITALLEQRAAQLDARFRFNELLMDVGVLPPVISQAQDAVALDGPTMRVAQRLYRLDEPARFVTVAPSWRNWLQVGLAPELRPQVPRAQQLLPRDEREQAFWQSVLDESYAAGVAQARSIFELNLARLERTYLGMRLFLDLYARGMVTMPRIVAADAVIEREDENTVVIGSTVFRITQQADFVEEFDRWKPLGR